MNALLNTLKEDLEKAICGEVIISESTELNIGKVTKITFKRPGSNISPSFKLTNDWLYGLENDYNRTKRAIINSFENAILNIPSYFKETFSFDEVKRKIGIEVVGVEQNVEKLQEIPHRIICDDLAITYRIFYEGGSALVTNDLLRSMSITEEELHNLSISNALKTRPMTIRPLFDMVQDMLGVENPIERDEDVLFVATTEDRFLGASVLAYPGFVNAIKEKFHSDMYVIPSSIHELILVSTHTEIDPRLIKSMIEEVNITEVSDQDKLSDSLYYCDINEGCVKRVDL